MKKMFLLALTLICNPAFSNDFEQVLELINGERVDVISTPHFCNDTPPAEPDIKSEIAWRIDGVGKCKNIYTPDIRGIFTPLSHGGEISQFFFDEKKYQNLVNSIDKITNTVDFKKLHILNKLDIQMTMWELISVLEWRRDLKIEWQPKIDQKKMDLLLVKSNKLLSKVLFNKNEIDQLNQLGATYSDLEKRKSNILKRCFFEVDQPGRIHESMSQGRLYGRIFIGTIDSECASLKSYISKGDRSKLVRLPEFVSHISTMLLLNFNVLDEQYNVIPTQYLYAWREINYLGLIDQKKPIFEKLAKFKIETFEYKKENNLVIKLSRYEEKLPNAMTRLAMVDVNPVYNSSHGAKVTSNLGNCYSCHSSTIKTFDFRTPDSGNIMAFSPPFKNSEYFYKNEPLLKKISAKFLEWRNKYN